jgi:hypothetical protein
MDIITPHPLLGGHIYQMIANVFLTFYYDSIDVVSILFPATFIVIVVPTSGKMSIDTVGTYTVLVINIGSRRSRNTFT